MFNLNIEDIVSNRDIIFDSNNNNISEKIESLEEESKNILNDLNLKRNNININDINIQIPSKDIGLKQNEKQDNINNINYFNDIKNNDRMGIILKIIILLKKFQI